MNLWKDDDITGKYPPLRVTWHLLTVIPVLVLFHLTVATVFIHAGPQQAKHLWKEMF